MKWEIIALKTLESEFRTRIFSTEDAFKILNKKKRYSRGTVYRVLHDLHRRGSIERLGRGIYRIRKRGVAEFEESVTISARLTVEFTPGPLTKARELLKNKGIEFMVTGGSLLYRFFHHLPKRFLHLIYVVKGSGEPAVALLREAGFRALLNPSRSEISLALENFPERDIFIIREFSELLGNVDGSATIERAMVDLYFESTRERIPFPEEEVGRILYNILRSMSISITRLLFFASRRGIKEEMRAIIKLVEPGMPVSIKTMNPHVRKVIKAMEALR